LPLSVALDLLRRSAQNFKFPVPLVYFEIYVALIKDNFFTPPSGALKFRIVPLKSKLRGDCVTLEFCITLLNGEFCVSFVRCFGILRRARKRLI